MKKQIFMDTAFLIAVIDSSDNYHISAVESYKKIVKEKWSVITTEAVLIETGNGLSEIKWRQAAYKWITQIQKSKTIFKVIPITTKIVNDAVDLYGQRQDKEWGLTDCISIIVMQEYKLTNVLTTDHHFEQAGFKIYINL
jgi:predicted nucleic acid-binding protein